MKANFKLDNPDKVVATLTITATLEELRFLRTHSEANHGNSEFRDMLAQVIERAEKGFYANSEPKEQTMKHAES